MDTFSHGFWAGTAYYAINRKLKKKLDTKLAVFWSVIPDLLSFGISFFWIIWSLINRTIDFSQMPRPDTVGPNHSIFVSNIIQIFYNISHSLIIFLLISALVFLVSRRIVWEMGGWLIHVLMDIPTHSFPSYPTPIFWPVSNFKFNGYDWETPWFLILNFALVLTVALWIRKKRKIKQQKDYQFNLDKEFSIID